MAGRGQGERDCQTDSGHPLHSRTIPTTHARRLPTSHGSTSHAARHHARPCHALAPRLRSLLRRASCTSTAVNGSSRSTSTRFARTSTRRPCPPRSTTTYTRGTPPSRPRGARRRRAARRKGVERGRAERAAAPERAPSRAYRTSQPASPSLSRPPPPPRQVKTVERTTFDDEAERQSEIARGRAERQETVVKVTAPSRPNPPPPTLTHLPKPRP